MRWMGWPFRSGGDLASPDQLGSLLTGAGEPDLWFLDSLVACAGKVVARGGDREGSLAHGHCPLVPGYLWVLSLVSGSVRAVPTAGH